MLRMVLEAHTAKVLVFDSFDRRPSDKRSTKWGDARASLSSCGNWKAVQISPNNPQHAPTRPSVRSGSWLIASTNRKMCNKCGRTTFTPAETQKSQICYKIHEICRCRIFSMDFQFPSASNVRIGKTSFYFLHNLHNLKFSWKQCKAM